MYLATGKIFKEQMKQQHPVRCRDTTESSPLAKADKESSSTYRHVPGLLIHTLVVIAIKVHGTTVSEGIIQAVGRSCSIKLALCSILLVVLVLVR
jgi:hypothetical protein